MQTYTPPTQVVVPTYCELCERYVSIRGQQVRDDLGVVIQLNGFEIDGHLQARHPEEYRRQYKAAWYRHRQEASA